MIDVGDLIFLTQRRQARKEEKKESKVKGRNFQILFLALLGDLGVLSEPQANGRERIEIEMIRFTTKHLQARRDRNLWDRY